MATSADLIATARKNLGYSRWTDPESGTIFGRWYAEKTGVSWYGASGVPFCAMGVSYWLEKAGVTCAGYPTASCNAAMNAAIAKGAWRSGNSGANPANRAVSGIQAGDVVIFNWGNKVNGSWDGGHDHTGICVSVADGGINTIEANTNNGQVASKFRQWRYVQGYIRPDYSGGSSVSASAIDEDGLWGTATSRLAQMRAGTYVDGEIDGQNPQNKPYLAGCTTGWNWVSPSGSTGGSPLIRAAQTKLNSIGYDCGEADGIAGKQFAHAMIAWGMAQGSGATVNDSKLDEGGATIKCFQRMLNAGKWFG